MAEREDGRGRKEEESDNPRRERERERERERHRGGSQGIGSSYIFFTLSSTLPITQQSQGLTSTAALSTPPAADCKRLAAVVL